MSTPANPAKTPEMKKDIILYWAMLMPEAWAACSESRMAIKARPILDFIIRREATIVSTANVQTRK